MQMNLMIAISVLAGCIAAGAVWLVWELAIKLRQRGTKKKEDADLLATAKEPKQRPQ